MTDTTTASSADALKEWEMSFGSLDDYTTPSKSAGFQFEFETNYKVRIERATKMTSSRDDAQIVLDLVVMGEQPGKHTEYLVLPIQPVSDRKLDKELLGKLTVMRRDSLRRILSVTDPRFAIKGKLSVDEERDLNRAVLEKSLELQALDDGTQIDEWTDTLLYLVQVPNRKNKNYPYRNLYPTPVKKYPVHGDDTPF